MAFYGVSSLYFRQNSETLNIHNSVEEILFTKKRKETKAG